ncbi:DNA polymerase III subunit beta, partial [bacterium]|nr:DNA polymerase III subunit beta [bacterium]
RNEKNLEVECDNYKTKIKGQSAEDFPLIPGVETSENYKVNIKDFKKALSKVVFSTSTSESRIELTGILFTIKQGELIMASTDSYRLSEKKIKIKTEENSEKSVIVPSKTIQEILRILSNLGEDDEIGQGEDMDIFISDSQVLFKTEKTELVSRLIEGQYPDYKQIIPKDSKTKSTINRQEFLQAVKASALFSKVGINDISIDFPKDKNQTIISSVSGQTGENVVEIDSQTKGEDNSIIVNYQYLLDGLKNMEDENVEIFIIDNNTPCIIKPKEEENYLYIIMPIKQ